MENIGKICAFMCVVYTYTCVHVYDCVCLQVCMGVNTY